MHLFINLHKLIVSRNGSTIIANVSGTTQSLVLNNADLALIDIILAENGLANESTIIEKAIQHPIIRSQFSSISSSLLMRRLNEYKPVNLVLDKPTENPPIISLKTIDYKNIVANFNHSIPLRLTTNFGVVLSPEGFGIWSVKDSCFYRLDAQIVALLCAFHDGKSPYDIVHEKQKLNLEQEQLEKIIQMAIEQHWLTDIKQKITQSEKLLKPFNTDTETSIGLAKTWDTLEKENKIPVYFVPHMENHLPLALGVLYSALLSHNKGSLLDNFQFIPLNYLPPKQLFDGPYRKFGTGIWLFSNYMWSIDINMEISQAIKRHNPNNYTIHGGPSTPDYQQACEDFLNQHPSVDIAVHGEGEVTITEIFECLQKSTRGSIEADVVKLSKVGGLTYREPLSNRLIRTGPRERMKTPDIVPSPYLTGLFDGYQGRVEAAIIETNRGCPYGCTFCDWGSATNQKIRKFDLDRVKEEINWIGKNKVRVLWIADANYGLYDRDIEISQFIVDTKKKYGFPKEIVVNYTKNSTWRLVEIIKIFSQGGIIGQGIISIQTTDEKTLEVINRKNIRTQRYDELAQAFTDLNLPLSTDLMIGLPGMTVESFTADLQRYMDMDVAVKAYPTQLLPNSPMAEPTYMEKYKIKTDEHSFLTSTYSYTLEDRNRMLALYQVYVMADGYSLLRYVMRFLQWEYNIQCAEFIANLLDDITAQPDAYPLLTWSVRYFNKDKSMPGGWTQYYEQVRQYLSFRYSVGNDSALDTVIKVNQYSMPDDALTYPFSVELKHDFYHYFCQSKEGKKALSSFTSATMEFTDPNRLATIDLDAAQYDTHQYFWELHSSVARAKSIAEFAA